LDIWDGKGVPVILHGNTLMKEIEFSDVVKCIRDNAFVTSKYPIILSLENHCSIPMQEQMAADFKNILGKYLAEPPTQIRQLPSPEELTYKIILKGSVSPSHNDDPTSETKVVPQKFSEQLTKITYLRAAHINLSQPSKHPLEMCSFEETKHEKISKSDFHLMLEYCKDQMARIYPTGTRVTSSNYSPITAWNMGCQLVALNCQTADEPMWINQAKFEDNGNCGYVLKPPIMMHYTSFDMCSNPKFYQGKNSNTVHGTLKVEIIGARMLPEPTKTKLITLKRSKPSVCLKMVGIDLDAHEHEYHSARTNDLFIPHWNPLPLSFKLEMGEMALLIVRVDQGKNQAQGSVANYCIPVKCLREGYRVLALRNSQGDLAPFSTLLVHVSWLRE